MKEMEATGMAPGVVCHTILLNAYGKQGDLAAADEVLKDMLARGIQPNKYTFSSLMGWHSQQGNLAKVQVSRKHGLKTLWRITVLYRITQIVRFCRQLYVQRIGTTSIVIHDIWGMCHRCHTCENLVCSICQIGSISAII